ncbi:hypothetical protein ACFSSC_01650 [Corynebacterium mendelii]|uniref:Cardiolipin synthase N-terminal domain-containing protein n=1 Tax=Corynebacterium mendelii TaxID=2765362 RepID=A0A939IX06_9CORY|nr:hypothetical protein [Corynebacterium mendelii]MBN9643985.1 hypothetical protein [Corynebacterium mendelii]
MNFDGQSPLMPTVVDGIFSVLAIAVIIFHLVVFFLLIKDRRSLSDTIVFGLIVVLVPLAGPAGYLFWRTRRASAL